MKSHVVVLGCLVVGAAVVLVARGAPLSHAARPPAGRAPARAEVTVILKERSAPVAPTSVPEALRSAETAYLSGDATDRAALSGAQPWDEFYGAVKALRLPMAELEELIFTRLQEELGLSDEARVRLQQIYDREQVEVTKAALARYGRQLLSIPQMSGDAGRAAWDELRSMREQLRRGHDASYLAVVTRDQLDVVARHLRNDVIIIKRSVTSGGNEQVLIMGAGDPSLLH